MLDLLVDGPLLGDIDFSDFLRQLTAPVNIPTRNPGNSAAPRRTKDLGQFLLRIIGSGIHTNVLTWESEEEGIFRIIDEEALLQMWQQETGRSSASDRKTAIRSFRRLLRKLYEKDFLQQVQGQKTYAFTKKALALRQSQNVANSTL